ncbi:MAG: hypothetical protein CBB65_14540 [Hyphomonadaceae bacterium TMED5]|nr:hypothetical protein [Ponticaulis sp.]OUX97221.1 MAG: hypothetical protein CBB65_14540 [Hyphomonadaceae bacterium TMED5]|tara:strand:+ start:49258 stop:51774 length:2517 start_codon:yes stop_codon:yes gene_type:complete
MPYLDGIRAIAVIGVVLFHLGFKPIHGGFTGVDVFFVLSGFLITTIIGAQHADGRFSFTEFYIRRARRLLPALLVVIFFVLIGSFLILSPDNFQDTARSAIYAALSAANVNYWLNAGYFDSAKYATPLLHTWSLGVEEQFYLVFPAIMILLLKFRSRIVLLAGFAILAALSFWGMIALADIMPNGVFYLSPFRAWQFAVGSIVAILWAWKGQLGERFIHPIVDALFTLAGIAILVYAFLTTSSSGYPGYASIIPTVGTLMLILGGANLVSKALLANPVATFFGNISYSLYLWHWPVIVFIRYYFGYSNELTWTWFAIAAIVSLILAYLSYTFIETPLRRNWNKDKNVEKFAVPAGISVFSILAIVISAHVWSQGGWVWRLSENTQRQMTDLRREKEIECTNSPNGRPVRDICFIGDDAPEPSFFVVGDSHARALSHGVSLYSGQDGMTGEIIVGNGRLPFMGVNNVQGTKVIERNKVIETMQRRLEETGVDTVILHSRWSVHWHAERARGEEGRPTRSVGRDGVAPSSIEESQANFIYGMNLTFDWLEDNVENVIIVGNVPTPGVNVRQCALRPSYIISEDDLINGCGGYSREESLERSREVNEIVEAAARERGFAFVNPMEDMCPEGMDTCLRVVNNNLMYMDDDHLSIRGSRVAARRVWRAAAAIFRRQGDVEVFTPADVPAISEQETLVDYVISGSDIETIYSSVGIVSEEITDAGLVLSSDADQAEPRWATGRPRGGRFEIPEDMEMAFGGHSVVVEIDVERMTDETDQVAIVYSSNQVGNSGWQYFDVPSEPTTLRFGYDVNSDENAPNGDYLGILPLEGSILVKEIRISSVE